MDLLDGHGLHAGTSGNSHRRENGQKDQKGLGEFANAEPDDDQRQIGQRRQWTIEFDNRVEQATHDTIDTHQYANWNRRDQGKEKAAQYTLQTGFGMLEQGDRTSVVWGQSVAVRVDLGGSRIIKK